MITLQLNLYYSQLYLKWFKFFLRNKSKLFKTQLQPEELEIANRVARLFGYQPIRQFRKEGNVIYL